MNTHVLQATSSHGWGIFIGPVGVHEGQTLIDRYLAPHGWTGRFIPITPTELAIRQLSAGSTPELVEDADFFVYLRLAITGSDRHDGADDDNVKEITAHAEAHRLVTMWTGDEECLLGECDHDRTDSRCPDVVPASRLCAGCSLFYDSGSEYGPKWPLACRVAWPCTPLRAIARFYKVDLPKLATTPVHPALLREALEAAGFDKVGGRSGYYTRWRWDEGDDRHRPSLIVPCGDNGCADIDDLMFSALATLHDAAERGEQAQRVLDLLNTTVAQEAPNHE